MILEAVTRQLRIGTYASKLRLKRARRRWRARTLRVSLRGRVIEQLLLVPVDLRTSDPSFASEIYHGQFGLAGSMAAVGTESPFTIVPPSAAWERELHAFGWLRHLRAAGDEISREHARALVRDWIYSYEDLRGVAWEPEVVARRVISWLCHIAIVLERADRTFYDMVMYSLTRQIDFLQAVRRDAPEGMARLISVTALLYSGLCASGREALVEQHLPLFAQEIDRQIFPDGGHKSRNPGTVLELLLDLLPLRQCFVARGRQPPQPLIGAIERLIPMLRFFRIGNGDLARFNGVGSSESDSIAAVLAHDDVRGKPLSHAPHSGYWRGQRGRTTLIAEIGRAPVLAYSRDAHAGCLSFELASNERMIIVNCGAPRAADQDWRLVSRSTAAHSTLTVCDTSSSRFVPTGISSEQPSAARLLGPDQVDAKLFDAEGGFELVASHNGYASRFGITHVRRLRLSANGEQIMGEDRLLAPRGLKRAARRAKGAFVVRFHLDPSIRAQLSQDGRTALLLTPEREGWRLNSPTHVLSIEDSVLLADPNGPRRTLQIAIPGTFETAREARVMWALERSMAHVRSSDQGRDAEKNPQAALDQLPLLG